MKKILLVVTTMLLFCMTLNAETYRKHRVNPHPVTATKFELTDTNGNYIKTVDRSVGVLSA